MNKKHRAFSLIELSIVLLVIGILIAGVTQSSVMVDKYRLSVAQNLTKTSPVASISGLALWLESTSDDSFLSTEALDGTQVSRWNDLNPQNTAPYFALKTASSAVTYVAKSSINSLPSLYFNGTSGVNSFFSLSTSSTSTVSTPLVTRADNAFTFFVVAKAEGSASGTLTLFNNGINAGNGWSYGLTIGSRVFLLTLTPATVASVSDNAEVISGRFAGGVSSSGALNLYVNGVAQTLSNSTAQVTTPTTGFYVGAKSSAGSSPWKGYISEIIIFSAPLTTSDRKYVEQYLGKKYGITVS